MRKKKEEKIEEKLQGRDLPETMSVEELRVRLRLADPDCKRGGCMHVKSMHFAGNDYPNECHLCRCRGFIE